MTQTPEEAAAEFVTFSARLTRAVRRAVDPATPAASIRLLSVLDELGPSTVTALAEADRSSQPTMTAAVKVLVENGWAVKRPHPDDARASLVEPTAAGRAMLAGARRTYGALLADRLAPYTVQDVAAATDLIKHLLEKES